MSVRGETVETPTIDPRPACSGGKVTESATLAATHTHPVALPGLPGWTNDWPATVGIARQSTSHWDKPSGVAAARLSESDQSSSHGATEQRSSIHPETVNDINWLTALPWAERKGHFDGDRETSVRAVSWGGDLDGAGLGTRRKVTELPMSPAPARTVAPPSCTQ